MNEEQVKEQLQAAQDLVDTLTDQRNQSQNAIAQINAMRRAEARQTEKLKADLQTALNKIAELEERLSKAVVPNGVDTVPAKRGRPVAA